MIYVNAAILSLTLTTIIVPSKRYRAQVEKY